MSDGIKRCKDKKEKEDLKSEFDMTSWGLVVVKLVETRALFMKEPSR